LSSEDLKIFDTKIIPFREGKILTVTELPNTIIRYKFNNFEKNFSQLNIQNINMINSNNDYILSQPKILTSLEERFSKVDCFNSNFQSNYRVNYYLFQ
jgi:hypothetical protein